MTAPRVLPFSVYTRGETVISSSEHNARGEELRTLANTHTHPPSEVFPGEFPAGTFRMPGTVEAETFVLDNPVSMGGLSNAPLEYLAWTPTAGAPEFTLPPNTNGYHVYVPSVNVAGAKLWLPQLVGPIDGYRVIVHVGELVGGNTLTVESQLSPTGTATMGIQRVPFPGDPDGFTSVAREVLRVAKVHEYVSIDTRPLLPRWPYYNVTQTH